MPLWGQRGHRRGSQSASGDDLVTRLHATSLNTSAGLPRIYDVSNPVDADSSSSDEDYLPKSSRSQAKRPPHHRSLSHPFPSPFSGHQSSSRRPSNSNEALTHRVERSDDDGRDIMPRQSVLVQRRGSAGAPRDMTAGTCMTCGGTMRWPQNLTVFKCTLCATVNDLVPSSPPKNPSSTPCLTLDHTRHLIRQSIRSYFCRRLLPDPLQNGFYGNQRLAPGTSSTRSPSDHTARPASRSPARQAGPGEPPSRYGAEGPGTHRRAPQPHSQQQRRLSDAHEDRPSLRPPPADAHSRQPLRNRSRSNGEDAKRIFKHLEDYVAMCFGSFDCINSAFPSRRPQTVPKAGGDVIRRKPVPSREPLAPPQAARKGSRSYSGSEALLPELDPKLLLLGDVGENGTWWTGSPPEASTSRSSPSNHATSHATNGSTHPSSHKLSHTSSPHIHWDELVKWYHAVINAAEDWFVVYEEIAQEPTFMAPTERDLRNLESDLMYAQDHVQRHLMKATEILLKRPGRPLKSSSDVRFLLVILENPLLHSKLSSFSGLFQNEFQSYDQRWDPNGGHPAPPTGPVSGQHSGIIKRIVGLASNSSQECQDAMIAWFARSQTKRFTKNKDLISTFLTYRMLRSNSKRQEVDVDITAGLIPQMQAGRSGAYLHDEIGGSRPPKKSNSTNEKKTCYAEDWQIKAAARFLALFFAANNVTSSRRLDDAASQTHAEYNAGHGREGIQAKGQLLPTSDFYLSIIDYSADLISDFEAWEGKRGKFAFCQYPFLLSIRAKTEILEHDARRQMQTKARDAFFDSIMSRRAVNQYFSLDVRRDCLVDDSLKAVSEVIGSGSEDIKKALRITFRGEEGIDGGGLRKEWFLMLIREVFNPDHGLFTYDDESQFCYFNPNSFETTDQFFLVGVVIGLAIYNSTILDVALPPFAFRKLLASAPAHGLGPSAHPRPTLKYTLDDLSAYRPGLARGLKQLLDFEGDVQSTFGLDFAIDIDKYGTTVNVPLCMGGERKPVTNANRREYVDLYVLYLLDTSVKRQFEPFKRGFYTVCGGNAFSLFRPEEIELLVRGSDQALDIPSLRAVATYDSWGAPRPNETEPVIEWFWSTFERAPPGEQRKLLFFITGSDRIPATGTSSLSIRVACLGDDTRRYPIARTCFNSISLFKYESREQLEAMLWRAVHESEGFGLK